MAQSGNNLLKVRAVGTTAQSTFFGNKNRSPNHITVQPKTTTTA